MHHIHIHIHIHKAHNQIAVAAETAADTDDETDETETTETTVATRATTVATSASTSASTAVSKLLGVAVASVQEGSVVFAKISNNQHVGVVTSGPCVEWPFDSNKTPARPARTLFSSQTKEKSKTT